MHTVCGVHLEDVDLAAWATASGLEAEHLHLCPQATSSDTGGTASAFSKFQLLK